MHPAPSIIFFTVFSGIGFGLLAFLGLGMPDYTGFTAFIFFLIAYVFAVGGLISSTFHLGNPQRALKAFTQWKTSWLSREGCLSVAALSVMGLYAIGVVFLDTHWKLLGLLGAALSLATVFGTSMIYTQIKTVPRWSHWTTPVLFLLYAIAGGAFVAGQTSIAAPLLLALGAFQCVTWFIGDKQFAASDSTIETATGLGHMGKVRMFEAPHSSKNYLMEEMVYVVGRKHVRTLRITGILCLSLLPYVLLVVPPFHHLISFVALLLHIAGALMTRWLFFAEAEHTVGLYYDQR
ncbi:dimethyl sulfoxide reductase anchor subunit family protein [Litoreibacter arenae]|uniref:Anaerobic dimethyl sulfoxide reductase chain C n=1 Tax=Litoreibacter arenae DSM 19593 TaxID=1123360 RepID=S9RUM3_9RHOB|nr:DmsC/YnfH family molybdoenzyme membrane anchor subunit [Litoreibacter arenae]EPX81750.1 Anaerobic dimethyl sulfoxide reductase chain C [Litoreibacter arenae DSM 19593]